MTLRNDGRRNLNTNMEETAGKGYSADQFEIMRELGRGGTSVVYLVRSKESNLQYAMKTLMPELADTLRVDAGAGFGGVATEMLRAEAETLAELSGASCGLKNGAADGGQDSELPDRQAEVPGHKHSGIPEYYGEVFSDGRFAGFLMEYVEGESLQKLLGDGRKFTVREVAETGVQLCSILAQLHEKEPPRIYRDLKPGNILMRRDGSCVLVDYGAVRAYRRGAAGDTHPLGTEGYAAPEQYGGWEQSDTRTDVYGIGAVLHHMLTGKTPLETGLRPLAEVMEGDCAAGIDANEERGLGVWKHRRAAEARRFAEMDKIVLRACSVAPSMRYSSCRELENALEKLCEEESGIPFGWGQRLFPGKCLDKEYAWRKFAALVYASIAFLVGAGLLGVTAFGAEMSRYRALISEAEGLSIGDSEEEGSPAVMGLSGPDADGNSILDRKLDLLRQAIRIRPQDSEAYLSLMRGLSSDGVLTQEEKEVLEDFLYENGYPGKMREWRPAEYAGLEMELGKVYFGCYEGGMEAARRAFGNAAESAGLVREERKAALAMCEVLGETWTADRIGAWKELVRAASSEAVRTGDGVFAAAVCIRAAGEITLFPDRFTATGADPADLRGVAEEVGEFAKTLKSGWPDVPDKTTRELETAAEAAWRVCCGE